MKKTYWTETVPTAHIAVKKSRIKLYDKEVDTPTYYLQKNQEFEIEIFNPTSNVILAKIHLNGKAISQGGLVLKPGQRVFLDRYFDVAKKFLFDTYEVENTDEVKKAIENNGDLKIEFYEEIKYKISTYTTLNWAFTELTNYNNTQPYINTVSNPYLNVGTTTGNINYLSSNMTYASNNVSYSNKSIETGIIEKGSDSNQKFDIVDKTFEYLPFHTVKYKLLPISQKINTLEDINVKRYCTNCGHKVKQNWNFCPSCSNKI